MHEFKEDGLYIVRRGKFKKLNILASEERFGGNGEEDFFIGVNLSYRDLDKQLDWGPGFEAMKILTNGIIKNSYLLNVNDKKEAFKEIEELKGLFDQPIFVEEVPFEYSSEPWTVNKRNLIVTTTKGRIRIGHRKRVISIDYSHVGGLKAEQLFKDEDVTRFDYTIHAWGLIKAREYICKILTQS